MVCRAGYTDWTPKQVRQWAVDEVGIDQEDVDNLPKNVDGSELAHFTEGKLERWGIPAGTPASKLARDATSLWT